MAQTYNPSPRKAEAGDQCMFKGGLSYSVNPCIKRGGRGKEEVKEAEEKEEEEEKQQPLS